jgi:hypothetical protein
MKILTLSGCEIGDPGVWGVFSACYGLSDLNISNCVNITDAAFIKLENKCPRLAKLNISGCVGVSNSGCMEMGSCISFFNASLCQKITDAGVIHILSAKLRELNLFNCTQITGEFLARCSTPSKWNNIISLNLGRCAVTDDALAKMADACPCLEFLNISYCKQITEVSVKFLSQKCQKLEKVNMFGCNFSNAKVCRKFFPEGVTLIF